MVGSEAAANAFKAELTYGVVPYASHPAVYGDLLSGVHNAIERTVAPYMEQAPRDDFTDLMHWDSIRQNARVGAGLTVAMIVAVGDAYCKYAKVPQDKAHVSQNLGQMLLHTQELALSGKVVSIVNMEAMRRGLDAQNNLQLPWILVRHLTSRNRPDFHKGVAATVDQVSGQVSVAPRHLHRPRVLPRQCPAVNTPLGPEQTGSALWTFMQSIGQVAVTTIYPAQFEIR